MKKKYIVVLVTAKNHMEAEKIASVLIKNRLAACVNIIRSVDSLFHWKGKLCREKESLMVIKTSQDAFESLKNTVKKTHSYTVPEIIALPIIKGNKSYLDWVGENVSAKG